MALSCSKKKKKKEITPKNNGDFYYFNCYHSFRKKIELGSHKKVRKNKNFCDVIMPSEDTKILEFNQYKKFDKAPFIIFADIECIKEKCKNNPENSSTTKVSKHVLSGLSVSTISSFRSTENTHDVYRGKNCINKVCGSLREQAMKILNL